MKRFEKIVYNTALIISGVTFCAIVIAIVINVFCRFIFLKSYAWVEEIAYMCFTWSVFFGICLVYSQNGLVAIDALVDRIPAKAKRVVGIIVNLLLLAINVLLVVWGLQLLLLTTRVSPNLRVSYRWVYLGQVLSFAICSYYSIKFFILSLRNKTLPETSLENQA